MGGGQGKSSFHGALRDSILGLYLLDEDMDAFSEICVTKTASTTGVVSHSGQRIIIALEGELAVCATAGLQEDSQTNNGNSGDLNRRSSFVEWFSVTRNNAPDPEPQSLLDGEAVTLRRNDNSFIFNSDQANPDQFVFGNIQLTYYSKVKDKKPVSWISIGEEELKGFLSSRAYLSPLSSLLDTRLSSLLASQPLFRGFSPKQLDMLGPLVRLSGVEKGDILLREAESASDVDGGLMAILLSGTLVELPYDTPPPPTASLARFNLHTTLSDIKAALSQKSVRASKKVLPVEGEEALSGKELEPGSAVGPELCLIPKAFASRSVVAKTACVVALLSRHALYTLADLGSSMMKAMHVNLMRTLLEGVRSQVPLLGDMSDKEFYRLAVKMDVHALDPGTVIFREGDPGDRFYIIVMGGAKVIFSSGGGRCSTEPLDSHTHLRDLGPGRHFGEISLVTAATRSSTVVTTSRTLLLSIDDKTFRSVLDRNLEHVSEMNIKLAGENVELVHILRHSRGYAAFMDFLEREHSSESLLFWRAVDRYEDLCARWEASHQPGGAKDTTSLPELTTVLQEISPTAKVEPPPNGQYRPPINRRMLHELATAIMIRFIFDGAACQVERDYHALSTYAGLLPQRSMRDGEMVPLSQVKSIDANLRETMSTPAPPEAILASSWNSEEGDAKPEFKTLFFRPKSEVYGLLKMDNYKRWKEEDSFMEYINSAKPYVAQSGSVDLSTNILST